MFTANMGKLTDPVRLKMALTGNPAKKIVLTGGIFDLLKPFHIDLIEFSACRGEVLVVAVEKEGKYTPLDERLEILNEMEKIDHLFVYNKDDHQKILPELCSEMVINKEFDPGDYKNNHNVKIIRFIP